MNSMSFFKEFVGERVNVHLRDGSVIVNILLTKIDKKSLSYKVRKDDLKTFQILKRNVEYLRRIPLNTIVNLENSL